MTHIAQCESIFRTYQACPNSARTPWRFTPNSLRQSAANDRIACGPSQVAGNPEGMGTYSRERLKCRHAIAELLAVDESSVKTGARGLQRRAMFPEFHEPVTVF